MTEPTETSDVLKLTALDLYIKSLKPHVERLRAEVTAQMKAAHDERKAAVLPDGTKIGAVSVRKGSTSAHVADPAALLRWAIEKHPEQIMQAIRPAFVSLLLEAAKKEGYGFDPATGEALDFIKVTTSEGGITITTTPEGKARMEAIAGGYARTLTPPPEAAPQFPDNDPYEEKPQ